MARTGGGGGVLLLALLAAIAAGGAWNYHRNAEIDAAVPRPFRGYADADLAALLTAYRAEVDALPSQGSPSPESGSPSGPLLGDRIREFERIQRKNERARVRSSARLDREVVIAEIEQEQGYRRAEADRLQFHLRRLLTLPE